MKTTERKLGPGDDAEMINSPDQWPCWPILPMKNYKIAKPGEGPETGIMRDGRPTEILVGCLGITDWIKAERIVYGSVAELLAAGWIVD